MPVPGAAAEPPYPAPQGRRGSESMAAFFCLAVALLLLWPGLSIAQRDAGQARAELAELEREIANITAAQRKREAERGTVQARLREAELALGQLREEQRQNARAIDTSRGEIQALEAQQNTLNSSAAAQQGAVAAELREVWKSQGGNQLKLLLEESDPQRFARMLAYYRYLLGARSKLLDSYRETLAELAAVESRLAARQAQLDEQRQSLAHREEQLATAQSRRQQALQDIENALASDAATLEARENDREQLEGLLAELEAALARRIPEEGVQPFSAAKGQMNWPVDGRITRRFGSSRNQGKMRWQGVRLRAESGSTVTAIHQGRVVFADWLRGSGLLLVIDHGEGYMSLYAHNESLLREVGDWVRAGAAVATVGDSGGQDEAGLYFEIRKDGKPTDPQQWCRG